jgi:bacillithiol biosynthesis cysteine-adding enzyme BshC
MESHCIRHSDLPHTSKLFNDLVYHFDRVAKFYEHAPFRQEPYATAAGQVDYPADRRRMLVEALREQNGDSMQLELLARPGTMAVVTGQQVGLFSGPSYTIYKALTAARLAARLNEQGISAVPVFWLATEDHDFAEIDHSWSFDASQNPRVFRVDRPNGAERPVGEIPLPQNGTVSALKESLSAFPFGAEVAGLVEESYVAGKPIGAAFANLLKRLLSSYGLLFLDPLKPAIRNIATPLLRQAVERAPELLHLVTERNAALHAAGYHAQVHIEADTSLFFLLTDGRRLALKRHNSSYVAKDLRLSGAELARMADRLSPNALLRPVVQDYILPTVGYVGGPAELAYMAQSQVLYRNLLGRMPVVTPRSGFTLLDERAAKLMKRYGLSLTDIFHGEKVLSETISRKLIPPELRQTFQDARKQAGDLTAGLKAELGTFDVSLASAMGKSAAKILYQLDKMERKAARESLRRDERARADAAYLYNLVFPNKHLQERFYTILPFLARHGLDLIDRLYENVHLDCPDHLLLMA